MSIEIDLINLSNTSLMKLYEALHKIERHEAEPTKPLIEGCKKRVADYYRFRTGAEASEQLNWKYDNIQKHAK